MSKREAALGAEVAEWLRAAEATDEREAEAIGRDKSGDEMPGRVAGKKKRAAKAAWQRRLNGGEAKSGRRGEGQAEPRPRRSEKPGRLHETGKASCPGDREPEPKAQRNFTDPESRIMKTTDGFIQGYTAKRRSTRRRR